MTAKEFNQKYRGYIEEGFTGLEFDIPEVTKYLDSEFEIIIKEKPDFEFAQIKLKFGRCRFYSNLDMNVGFEIEHTVNELIS